MPSALPNQTTAVSPITHTSNTRWTPLPLWKQEREREKKRKIPSSLPPFNMDAGVVHSIIERINRGQAKSAENELESLRTTDVNGLALALLAIIEDQQQNSAHSDDMVVVGLIQSALLILKNIIPKSWSSDFREFKGSSLSPEAKARIRSGLLNLLGFSKSKVRSVTALLVAKIASVEYTNEWSDLIDHLLHMLQHGSPFHVYGALSTIKELVNVPVSDNDFARVGPNIISTLYSVAASPHGPQNSADTLAVGKYNPHASANAIEVFRECIEFLLIAEETQSPLLHTFVVPAIEQWSPLFLKYVGMQVDPTDVGYIDIKLEALKTYKALLTALPRLATRYALDMSETTLINISFILPAYEAGFIQPDSETNSRSSPPPDYSKANDVFLHPNLTVDYLVLEQLDYLSMAVELDSVVSKLASALPDLIDLLIRLGQISVDQEEESNHLDEFVLGEAEDLGGQQLLRPQIAEILTSIGSSSTSNLLPLLWDRIIHQVSQSNSWKIKESGLYIYSRILAEGSCDTTNITSLAISQFVQLVSECQHDSNTLLRSRAFLSAASVCRSLSHLIDTNSIKIPLFETTVNTAVSDTNDIICISCILAISKYCLELPSDYFITKESLLYQAIYLMSQKAQDATPAILAEVLVAVAQCDLSRAARNPEFVKLAYNITSKDCTNFMLTSEIQDIMAEVAETATSEDVYTQFIGNALEPLAESILSIKDWDYSPELVLSLSILSVLVDNGPYPLPEEIISTLFEPLYQIIMNSSDDQVLQIVTEILSFFTEHAPDQIKNYSDKENRNGVELLITAVDRLLDPVWLDSACINTGMLILVVVQNFGPLLGDLLPQMLHATVKRLAIAKDQALIGSLIAVFTKLVSRSAEAVVEILAETKINEVSGLRVVLSVWLDNFDVLKGYDEIHEQ